MNFETILCRSLRILNMASLLFCFNQLGIVFGHFDLCPPGTDKGRNPHLKALVGINGSDDEDI
jgi:hypothetical protein